VQADEAVGMVVARIVMRPVNDWQTTRIVNHFAAYLDAIAGANRAARRDPDVINDFDPSRAALHLKGFVHSMRARPIEESRRRRDRCGKVNPGRRRSGIRGSEIHRRSHHAPCETG
jgi:hypothetical protein